jgi:hypothetical protein
MLQPDSRGVLTKELESPEVVTISHTRGPFIISAPWISDSLHSFLSCGTAHKTPKSGSAFLSREGRYCWGK